MREVGDLGRDFVSSLRLRGQPVGVVKLVRQRYCSRSDMNEVPDSLYGCIR